MQLDHDLSPAPTRSLGCWLLVGLTLLSSCSSSDDDSALPPGESGTFTVALTDAASDDLVSFCVDVDSVRVTRTGGPVVSVLDTPARVDLVTLTDVSQILNVVAVQPALYEAAEVTFDFSEAEAWIVGEASAASIVDGDGAALSGSVTLPIQVDGTFAAQPGRNRILELDFDLDQSVRVDATSNTVTVEPAVILRVDRDDPKELVLVGAATAVDTATNTIDLEIQTLGGQRISDTVVSVDDATVYQIDGVPSTGAPGLTALGALTLPTWIQLYGSVDSDSAMFAAEYIEAGLGTYNGRSDIVEGHVVQRVGGAGADATLIVLGFSDNATHDSFQFNTQFTVTTSFAGSAVTIRGTDEALDTDAINIGQRVRIFGTLGGVNLDASMGVLRLQPTRLRGFANAAPNLGVVSVDVSSVGLRDESVFNWTHGGPTPPNPDAMMIDAGSLTDGLGIDAGTPVEVRGRFAPIADGSSDFDADSLANLENAPSVLLLADRADGMQVTPSVGSHFALVLAGMPGPGEVAIVDQGLLGTIDIPLAPTLTIQSSSGFGFFFLTSRTTQESSMYFRYSEFLAAIAAEFGQGADLYNVSATGDYSGVGTNSMDAGIAIVVMD